MRICDVILNLRETRRMTQMDVARGMNISQSAVSAIEKGIREPSYKMLERFADFFNVPLSDMLKDTDDAPSDNEMTIAEFIHRNPHQKILFDKTKFFSEEDMAVMISVANAIRKDRERDG